MSDRFRWAVLGAGRIAATFAGQLPQSQRGELVAVGSSDRERAIAFAQTFGGEPGSYEQVLAREDVDAVYVATVHTTHAELTVAALEAGKHVLCEKPLTPTAASAMALIDVAERSGKVLLEAFMYRFHPLTQAVLDAIGDGVVGDLAHVDASFAFHSGGTQGRLFDPALAGGGILDVGGYPVSYARAIAGAACGSEFADPISVTGSGTIGSTGVDEWAVAQLRFPAEVSAVVRTGVRHEDPPRVAIYGSRGSITIENPWLLDPSAAGVATVRVVGEEPDALTAPPSPTYALEADALANAVADGLTEVPHLSLANSLGNARTLQEWRGAVGVAYPFEANDADVPTISGHRLRAGSTIPAGDIPGVGRMSRLVMGCDNQRTLPHASAMFDAFVEAGGTTFDTAYVYGGGAIEPVVGRWLANRGIRADVQVIVKGAHTPSCDPDSLQRQLTQSLDRLGTDYADLYLMHRDNTGIDVSEFVDVLDAEVEAGRIRAFGGSNWTAARFDEANAYARDHGRRGFTVLSNHFGLAAALDVPWAGCEHVTDPESRDWLTEQQIPLLPWSSQARGFFAGRAHPQDRSDSELVRCYYSDANFVRLQRAHTLGEQRGVPTTAVALAYVLAQPFPTFPLIGPRTLAELRSSLRALEVELSPQDVAWLDLRET